MTKIPKTGLKEKRAICKIHITQTISILICKSFWFIFILFERQRNITICKGERRETIHLSVHSPNICNSHDEASQESGPRFGFSVAGIKIT